MDQQTEVELKRTRSPRLSAVRSSAKKPIIDVCFSSARRTFKVLGFLIVHEEEHATWAQVDGRTGDSTPVRIRMERNSKGDADVTFIAGTAKTERTRAIAHQLKDEFERGVSP